MKIKKIIAFILSLIILFFIFPVQSFADSTKTTESGNLTGYNATYRVDTKYRTSAILGQEVVDSRTLYIMGPASTGDYSTGERTPWSKLVTYQNVYITNKIIGSRLLYSTNVSKGVQAYNATFINDSAFSGNTMIQGSFPSAICVGDNAFSNCSNITSIIINGENLGSSGVTAYNFVLLNACKELGEYAFNNCTKMTSADLWGIQNIGNNAFLNCTALTGIIQLRDCTHIGGGAFSGTAINKILILQKDCIIDNESSIPENTVIYGYAGSTAQTYAETYNRTFVAIGNLDPNEGFKHYYKTYTSNSDGTHYAKCEICTNEDVGEHSYTSVVTKPTCTEKGYTTYTCRCGNSYIDNYVNANGHTWTVKAKHSDCTEWTCSVCNEEKITDNNESGPVTPDPIPTPGSDENSTHHYESIVTKPTCTERGYTTIRCTDEGCDEQKITDYTDALGHDFDEGIITTPATCTSDGVLTKTCKRDGCNYSETSKIAATGHAYKSKVISPTCTKDGYTKYTCSECGDSYTTDIVKAVGHNWNIKETYDTGIIWICSNCSEEAFIPSGGSISDDTTGHKYGVSKTVAPTCTEQGYDIKTCTDENCDNSIKYNYTDALGHSYIYTSNGDHATHTVTCSRVNAGTPCNYQEQTNCSFDETGHCTYCDQTGLYDVTAKVVVMEDQDNSHSHNYGVANVKIKINDETVATTDANGSFTIKDLEPGEYELTLDYEYGYDRTVTVTVAGSDINYEGNIPLVTCNFQKDNLINLKDTLKFYEAMNNNNSIADINKDGIIDIYDLKIMNKIKGFVSLTPNIYISVNIV